MKAIKNRVLKNAVCFAVTGLVVGGVALFGTMEAKAQAPASAPPKAAAKADPKGGYTVTIKRKFTTLGTPIDSQSQTPFTPGEEELGNGATAIVGIAQDLKAETNVPGPVTFEWSIEGTVIETYTHDIDDANDGEPVYLTALTGQTIKFFWCSINAGEPNLVSVRVLKDGKVQASKNIPFTVEKSTDPNYEIYTVDLDNYRSPGFNVLRGHDSWHSGGQIQNEDANASGDSGLAWGDGDRTFGTNYNGFAFLNWHWEFLEAYKKWRGIFNYGDFPGGIPNGVRNKPEHLKKNPAAVPPPVTVTPDGPISRVYHYVRLGEYQNLDELGRDVVHPWHNLGHGNIMFATGFGRMGNTMSPGSPNDTFWQWHGYIDEPRQDWVSNGSDKASATLISPAPNSTVNSVSSIIIKFDNKVSRFDEGSLIGIAKTKMKILSNGVEVVNGMDTMVDADLTTEPHTTYKFTADFNELPQGTITVVLEGTASYKGDSWTFTYAP